MVQFNALREVAETVRDLSTRLDRFGVHVTRNLASTYASLSLSLSLSPSLPPSLSLCTYMYMIVYTCMSPCVSVVIGSPTRKIF